MPHNNGGIPPIVVNDCDISPQYTLHNLQLTLVEYMGTMGICPHLPGQTLHPNQLSLPKDLSVHLASPWEVQ